MMIIKVFEGVNKRVIKFVGVTLQNAMDNAQGDVQRHNTTSHACSSARNAAGNASVSRQASMATSRSALATTTGRPKGVAPSALN